METSVGEDLAEVWWSMEIDNGFFFQEMWVFGFKERI